MTEAVHQPTRVDHVTPEPTKVVPSPQGQLVADPADPMAVLANLDAQHAAEKAPSLKDMSEAARQSWISEQLDQITATAKHARAQLEATPEGESYELRTAIVNTAATTIEQRLVTLAPLLSRMEQAQRAAYRDRADAAAIAMSHVRAWIESRTASAADEKRFAKAGGGVDLVLALIGLPPIGHRPHEVRLDEAKEARDELAELKNAEEAVHTALGAKLMEINVGMNLFVGLAQLDDPAPPSFVEELIKAVVVAGLGHLVGGLGGILMTRIALKGNGKVSDRLGKIIQKSSDVMTDMAQGTLGVYADKARDAVDSNQNARARIYFAEAFRSMAAGVVDNARTTISNAIAERRVTTRTLKEKAFAIQTESGDLSTLVFRQAAASWASYLAQSHLGTHDKRGADAYGRQISSMSQFLGTMRKSGDREIGSGNLGRDGIAMLIVKVDMAGGLHPGKLEIRGLNTDLTKGVVAEADGVLDKIWLPKVIQIEPQAGFGRAVLALDERNELRDDSDWNTLPVALRAHPDVRTAPRLASRLAALKGIEA